LKTIVCCGEEAEKHTKPPNIECILLQLQKCKLEMKKNFLVEWWHAENALCTVYNICENANVTP
jgi:hypothetical protein